MKSVKIRSTALIFLAALIAAFTVCAGYSVDIKPARAEVKSEYLRVITEDTPFYEDKSEDAPLFYLPYTYYVKVKEYGEVFTRVEYAAEGFAIDGYVPTDKLFDDGLEVQNPFPQITVLTASTATLYSSAETTFSVQYIFGGRTLYFYGTNFSPQGKTLYYVAYNDRLGYVKEEDLVPFTLSYHPNELTFLKPEPVEEPKTEEPEQPSAQAVFDLRIAIFAVLGLAGLIALIVAGSRKPKTSPAASYYDENDYE